MRAGSVFGIKAAIEGTLKEVSVNLPRNRWAVIGVYYLKNAGRSKTTSTNSKRRLYFL
jgi:hypothetical protein